MSREESLAGENRALKAEVVELRTRCATLDGRFAELRRAVDDLEAHAGMLENLFVASSRLHSTQDLAETLQVVSDILRDLVGARRFAVYMYDEVGRLMPILKDENSAEAPPPGTPGIAVSELRLGERRVGEVVVFELLAQKKELLALDHELLSLIGTQAAPALLSTKLLAERDQRAGVLRDFVKFLVANGSAERR